MRSPQRSRWLLPLAGLLGLGVIGAIVAAFVFGSGGGNGADPTAGSGNRVGQQVGVLIDATATDEPTATDEISATETVGVAAVGATEVAIEVATARSTTTAVSRPIETTPTAPTVLQPLPFVTGTPQPASGGDQSIALFQDFSTGDPGPFFVGTSAFGDSAIANGTYTLTVQQGNWQARAPDPPLDVGNGGAAVDVSIAGDGAAGMVGRLALQSGGAFTLLVCWLNANGSAGCHANDSNTWTELFSVAPGTIAVRDVNRLVMVAVGDQLLFQANDTIIGQVQLAAPGSGNWGMYVASSTGAVTAAYKQIVISTVSDNYLTQ